MGLLLGLQSAASVDQTTAIYRAEIFLFTGVYDGRRKAGGHKFQYRSRVLNRLDRGQCSFKHTSSLLVSEQQRIHPRPYRRKLFLGDADYFRLRYQLSFELLQHRAVAYQRRSRRSFLQRIQRQARSLGVRPRHGPAMRPDMAEDILRDQWTVLIKRSPGAPVGHLERL